MTKTIAWAIVGAALVGGAWYLFMNYSGGDKSDVPTAVTLPVSTSTPIATNPSGTTPAVKKPATVAAKIIGVGSITHLIAFKQSLYCSVKTKSGYSRTGTMYIADGKVRGNFANSSMLDDGTYLYAWEKGATVGLQLLAASSASGSAIARAGGIDLATDLSYACNPWVSDAGTFAPPSGVSFSSSL